EQRVVLATGQRLVLGGRLLPVVDRDDRRRIFGQRAGVGGGGGVVVVVDPRHDHRPLLFLVARRGLARGQELDRRRRLAREGAEVGRRGGDGLAVVDPERPLRLLERAETAGLRDGALLRVGLSAGEILARDRAD